MCKGFHVQQIECIRDLLLFQKPVKFKTLMLIWIVLQGWLPLISGKRVLVSFFLAVGPYVLLPKVSHQSVACKFTVVGTGCLATYDMNSLLFLYVCSVSAWKTLVLNDGLMFSVWEHLWRVRLKETLHKSVINYTCNYNYRKTRPLRGMIIGSIHWSYVWYKACVNVQNLRHGDICWIWGMETYAEFEAWRHLGDS